MKKIFSNSYLLAVTACMLWSTAFVGIKLGIHYTTPLNFAGTRFIISGLMVLPFAGKISDGFRNIKNNLSYVLLVGLFQTFLLYALFYIGINLAPASLTAIIVGGGPLFVALLAHFTIHDDKLTMKKALSILTGISGIIIIAADKYDVGWEKGKEFWGLIILVLANIAGSYGNILVSRGGKSIKPLTLNSAQQISGGIGILLLSFIAEDHTFGIKPTAYYISLFYLGFLSAAAFSIWFVLLKRPGIKVSEINIWKFLIPVFGAILSWAVLPDEKPELIPVIGMLLIAFSLILLNYSKRSKLFSGKDSKPRPV
ncbi:MAG TPA: DMT family transporter [Bacteroidales bacterium]|nr:DMT family transporter [Bacteroidales bacterium]